MLKNRKAVENLQGCKKLQPANFAGEILQVANFSNLRIFAGCEISQHCSPAPTVYCFLTRLFVVLYKSPLDVILVPLYTFVISLVLSTYISSALFVNQSTLTPSINQENLARSFLSPAGL